MTQQNETLLQLIDSVLAATSEERLNFILANESFALVPYQRALVAKSMRGRVDVCVVSGLVEIPENTPLMIELRQWLGTLTWPTSEPVQLQSDDLEADHEILDGVIDDWSVFVPVGGNAQDKFHKLLVLTAREPWSDEDMALLKRLSAVCVEKTKVLSPPKPRWQRWFRDRRKWLIACVMLAALAALVLIPVPSAVTAPAEVIALKSEVVTAPQDGVVREILVTPNSEVQPKQLLLTLDDTSVSGRRKVALESLKVARADALTASQKAFSDDRSKAELTVALGRVAEKEAELAALDAQILKVEVTSDRSGIAVFADADEWAGKPVQTGQKIMQIARPEDAGLLVWLSVFDAVNFSLGSRVKLFLHTDPLNAREAEIVEASYLPELSPASIASYRVKARFVDGPPPRLGLQGTARLTGEEVSLGYYLFRRPIAAVREWTGW
jgi:hypothetical protein